MNARRIAAGALAFAALAACAQRPADIADRATRAIFDDDGNAARGEFAPGLQRAMNDASIAAVSRVMHRDGFYDYVQQISQPRAGRYDYEVQFSGGTMLLQLHLDANRKIIGYHLIPNPVL